MKKGVTLALSVLVATVLLTFLPIHGEAQLYDKVIRLHVLAVSDADEDQAVKCMVRDRVLETVTPLLTDVQERSIAEAIVTSHLADIQESAQEALCAAGRTEPVSVTLTRETYPTRAYEGFTLPAGEYLSLRVIIGEGQGKNWWCVLFPSVCGRFAIEDTTIEDTYLEAGFTPEQYRWITHTDAPEIQVRFRLLEWLRALQQTWSEK